MTPPALLRHALPINFQFFLKLGDGYKIRMDAKLLFSANGESVSISENFYCSTGI